MSDIEGTVPSQWYWDLKRENARLRSFAAALERAHDEHLRTGDYVKLGIAAQDALLALAAQDALLALAGEQP